jgi:hypothetical protein
MLDGQALDPVTVYEGNFAQIENPSNVVYNTFDNRSGYYGYDFIGWTVDGVNIVDISTYEITQDTTFNAVLNYKVAVTFWAIFEDGTFDGAGGQLRREIQDAGTVVDTSWIETYYSNALGFSLTNEPTLTNIDNLLANENTFIYVVLSV